MRKTKIICTLGPSTDDPAVLRQLMLSGMDVARVNMSHQNHESHRRRIDMVKQLREELHLPVAVLIDTKGPEIRLGTFQEPKVELKAGELFVLTTEEVAGDSHVASISFAGLPADVLPGSHILIDDGLIDLEVQKTTSTEIACTVINGGFISANKGVNVPGVSLSMPFMSDRDRADIAFACEEEADFIAASFTRRADDVLQIRQELEANGNHSIRIIAKIENQEGVDNIDDILKVSDGIMVARGDMGVEIALEEIPSIQKRLIHKCRLLGKRVVTATEMLESMIQNPRPTRAEISDVANAVYDGTSAIMLSGESAAGKYPVEAVATMAQIAERTEQHTSYRDRFYKTEFKIRNNLDAISHATCAMAIDVDAKGIVVCSVSGKTAGMVSRYRCPTDIVGMTTDERVWRRLSLSWGVTPVLADEYSSMDVMFYNGLANAKKYLGLKEGDAVVLTGGPINGKRGNTNTIKVEVIEK